jgi:hypothetical protein
MKAVKVSVEELLKPRYIIDNEWFDCPYPNGTILIPINNSNGFGPEDWEPGMYAFTKESLDIYPYLTRKLNWWQEREESDLPEYVKDKFSGELLKIEYNFSGYTPSDVHTWNETKPKHWDNLYDLEPSTESDYLSYINSQPKP